jgi:3-deoxy-7-phosphoheptulonate synthase
VSEISWPNLPAAQQPTWPSAEGLARAQQILTSLPPLVFAGECDELKSRLAAATNGDAFVLMGGDCAETFVANTADSIRARLKTVLQMAIVLTYGASMPVVKIGRIAGQYGKPRSSSEETIDGVSLPSYRGDAVNGLEFTKESREPDPMRLVQTYHASAATLNLVRAFTQGGYADLRQVHSWNQDFVSESTPGKRYEEMAAEIDRALSFMTACGADPEEFKRADFYASHEALLLDYEKPLTRVDSRTGNLYDVSGHFVWVGERTRELDGAHIDFVSKIKNPIGVKIGPKTTEADILGLLEKLNPEKIPGRLMFITRMGAGNIRNVLPKLVAAVQKTDHPVLWVCDPMHGNTTEAASGHKTRLLDDVIDEVRGFFEVHKAQGTHPGGIHIELTGDDVTECLGGIGGVSETDLPFRYETACDPRLNRIQSLDLAFQVADMLRDRKQ